MSHCDRCTQGPIHRAERRARQSQAHTDTTTNRCRERKRERERERERDRERGGTSPIFMGINEPRRGLQDLYTTGPGGVPCFAEYQVTGEGKKGRPVPYHNLWPVCMSRESTSGGSLLSLVYRSSCSIFLAIFQLYGKGRCPCDDLYRPFIGSSISSIVAEHKSFGPDLAPGSCTCSLGRSIRTPPAQCRAQCHELFCGGGRREGVLGGEV